MNAFAERFSDGQRAALQALGYRVLERAAAGTMASRSATAEAGLSPAYGADAPVQGAGPVVARTGTGPAGRAGGQSDPGRRAPVDAGAADGAAAAHRRPAVIMIEDTTGGSALLEGILAAVEPLARAHPGRITRTTGGLRIDLGGSGDAWRVSIEELRGSPRHKAALWRGLRRLRAEPAR